MTGGMAVVSFVLLVGAAVMLSAPNTCMAFQAMHHQPTRKLTFIRFAANSNNEDVPSDDGQELAGQFYEQLKKRAKAEQNQSADDDNQVPVSPLPRQENSPSGASSEDDFIIDTDAPRPPIRKFTGASPSLFSEQTASSSNLQREREREFNLVGNFERSLGIQAAILFVSIIFVASVGFTGGITDGSDRYFGGADELDDTALEYVQTDDAAEAMLLRQSSPESQWL